MATSPTVAVPTTTAEIAVQMLAYQAGQSGTPSDINVGSQIRTLSESFGNVAEIETIGAMALALQTMVYGCWSAFGITPLSASQAQGTVTFSTGPVSPPPATQNITIYSGTIVQTTAGVQYATTETVTLALGNTSVNATAAAVIAGSAGNTSAGTILTISSGLTYPLYVNNANPFTGGTDAETIGQTQNRFLSLVQSIGLASPVAIANACIGVQAANSTETCLYATVYEPWVTLPANSQLAGYTVYIDNGSGTASSALILAVQTTLNGLFSQTSPLSSVVGYRVAGVPYSVLTVTPVSYSVVVNGTLYNSANDAVDEGAVVAAIQAYQTSLQFGSSIQQAQLNSAVGVVLDGDASAYTVTLYDSTVTEQTVIAVPVYKRALLSAVTVTLN